MTTKTRPHRMNFRATDLEVATIKRLAAAAGLSQSEYIRLAAMGLQFPQAAQ